MLKHQKGIGLIEILITLGLIAFSTLALIKLQSYLSYTTDYSSQGSEAMLIATQQLESMKDITSINDYNTLSSGSKTVAGSNTTYQLNWTVTENSSQGYKTIDLTTSWTDKTGSIKSTRLVTMISEQDPALSIDVM